MPSKKGGPKVGVKKGADVEQGTPCCSVVRRLVG